MGSLRQPPDHVIQTLLRSALGVSVSITGSEHLAPWAVMRSHLAGSDERVPTSVIVKWLRNHPAGWRTDPHQMHAERAALEFLGEHEIRCAPRLIASDASTELVVLEDLHPLVSLSDLLVRNDPLSGVGLRRFARTLGELHAATVGCERRYYKRRGGFSPVDPQVERDRFLGAGWHETPASIEALGVALPTAVERDLATVLASISDPGPFLAFSNGDAGANNFLTDGVQGHLIDFEFAGYRNALTDAACLYVPGPAWISITDPIATGLEAEYRQALGQAVPEAHDDRQFGVAIAAASMAYAILRLSRRRISLLDARPFGDNSRAQLVATLEAAAATADAHRSLASLSSWTRTVAMLLRGRWPDADREFNTTRYVARWTLT